MNRPTEDETEEQTAARQADYQRRQAEFKAEQERRETARQAEEDRIAKLKKKREASFQRILQTAPPVFSASQLRMLLRALVNLDPYTFADDLAVEMNGDAHDDRRSADEVLLTAIDGLADDKLTGFAVRLALAGHRGIPPDGEADYLTEAVAVFAPKQETKAPAKKPATVSKKTPPAKAAKRKA